MKRFMKIFDLVHEERMVEGYAEFRKLCQDFTASRQAMEIYLDRCAEKLHAGKLNAPERRLAKLAVAEGGIALLIHRAVKGPNQRAAASLMEKILSHCDAT